MVPYISRQTLTFSTYAISIIWAIYLWISSLWNIVELFKMNFRISTKASIIFMLISTAVWLCKTADNIATPCSVKAYGLTLECFNLSNLSQLATSSAFSLSVNWNLKLFGNLLIFLFTCSFNCYYFIFVIH